MDADTSATKVVKGCIIRTTMGDIHCRLYPEECPRTVENFTTHAQNGYYDGVIFHRVIKDFMVIQIGPVNPLLYHTKFVGIQERLLFLLQLIK